MNASISGQITRTESGSNQFTRKWMIGEVSTLNESGGCISLALTKNDQIHLCYWDGLQGANSQLIYARQTDQGWESETIPTTQYQQSATGNAIQGAQTAIGLTRAGEPLIAYFDLDKAQLMLARKSSGGWEVESVKSNEDDSLVSFAPGALCLAINDQDQPAITYFNHDSLKLARPQDGGWGIEKLAVGAGAGFFHDLALDKQGNPVIACHLLGKQELHLLRWVDEAFEDEMVDNTPNSGEYVSLALDGNDQAHLCCWRATGLIYFNRVNDGGEAAPPWHAEQVDSEAYNQGLGLYCKIGVSRTGVPKIAYYDGHNGNLKFALRGQDGAWLVETVDDGGGESGDAGGYVALALNSRDLAQIAYYDWGTQDVKFVQEPAPAGQGCLWLLMSLLKWFVSFSKWRLPRLKKAV